VITTTFAKIPPAPFPVLIGRVVRRDHFPACGDRRAIQIGPTPITGDQASNSGNGQLIIDKSDLAANQTIEKRGLPHIGATQNRNGKRH
jgi:hypothetical protein